MTRINVTALEQEMNTAREAHQLACNPPALAEIERQIVALQRQRIAITQANAPTVERTRREWLNAAAAYQEAVAAANADMHEACQEALQAAATPAPNAGEMDYCIETRSWYRVPAADTVTPMLTLQEVIDSIDDVVASRRSLSGATFGETIVSAIVRAQQIEGGYRLKALKDESVVSEAGGAIYLTEGQLKRVAAYLNEVCPRRADGGIGVPFLLTWDEVLAA